MKLISNNSHVSNEKLKNRNYKRGNLFRGILNAGERGIVKSEGEINGIFSFCSLAPLPSNMLHKLPIVFTVHCPSALLHCTLPGGGGVGQVVPWCTLSEHLARCLIHNSDSVSIL